MCLFREKEFKNGRNMSQDLKIWRHYYIYIFFLLGMAKGVDLNERQACERISQGRDKIRCVV